MLLRRLTLRNFVLLAYLLPILVHISKITKMPDSVKALRKENDGLKKQLQQLTKEFESMKAKRAERNEAMAASLPNQDGVQFLSDSYDNLVQSKDEIAQELLNLNRRLVELKENVGRIDKKIVELLFYSFQYNLKIIGVPQVK